MAVNRLRVTLDLDSGQFHMNLTRAGQAVTNFTQQVNLGHRHVQRIDHALTGLGARIRNLTITVGLARAALHNLWAVTGQWGRTIVETNARLERMNFLLRGLSAATTITEKIQDAERQFNAIIDTAKNAPFAINAITDTWVKFRSVGLDPTTGSLQSLLDAVASFGGTDEVLHRASIAIQQMAGKGVISMEELRQQLGEAVPTAIQLMARGMNMRVGDLVDKIASGTVEARSALQKLFAEFERAFGGSSRNMMQTFSGQLSKLRTNWMLFQQEVGKAGLMQRLREALVELNEAMDPERSRIFAVALGQAMTSVVDTIVNLVKWVFTYREEILDLTKAILGLIAVKRILVPLVLTLGAAFRALGFAQIVAVVTRVASRFGALAAAGAAVTLSVRSLAAALRTLFLTNPVGWILGTVTVMGSLIAAWIKYGDSVKRATEMLKEHEGIETGRDIEVAQKALEEQRERLRKAEGKLFAAEHSALWKNNESKLRYLRERVAEERRKYEELERRLNNAIANRARREAEAQKQNLLTTLQERLSEIQAHYASELKAHEEMLAKKNLTEEQYAEEIKKFRAEQDKRQLVEIERVFAEQRAKYEELRDQALSMGDRRAAGGFQQVIDLINDRLEEAKARMQSLADIAQLGNVFVDPTKPQEEHPAQVMIENLREKIAQVRAEITGFNGDIAKMEERIRSGDFDAKKGGPPASAEQTAEIMRLTRELAALEEQLKRIKEQDNAFKDAMEHVARAGGQVAEELALVNDRMLLGSAETAEARLRTFLRTMAGIRATLADVPDRLAEFDAAVEKVAADISKVVGRNKLLELQDEHKRLQTELIQNTRQRLAAEIVAEREALQAWIELNLQKSKIGRAHAAELLNQFEQNVQARWRLFESQQPLNRMLQEWLDATTRIEEAITGVLESATDAWVEWVETGKLQWGSLVRQILRDLLKIQLQKMIAGLITSAVGGFFGGGNFSGIAAQTNANVLDALGPIERIVPSFRKGGVMTPNGPALLRRYASGGIANRPQIAVYGEGDKPEAFVPLPDGRTIPVTIKGGMTTTQAPNVEVNVINQSGQDVSAEKGQMRFDGKNFVLDVVLKAATQPGPFRDGLRAAVR